MEVAGYIASLFIGISLGLIGGGGSVLTIPILVYFFGVEPVLATAYSLFIVGITSIVGVLPKWRKHELNIGVAIKFGIPSVVTVFLIRKFLIPLIPEVLFRNEQLVIYRDSFQLILFSLLMISAALAIMKPREISRPALSEIQGLALLGIVVGAISGFLGAGGGFIIIPALIFYASLSPKSAVGTSLLIIAFNSLIGFTGDLHYIIDWPTLLSISALGVIGSFVGHWLSGKLPGEKIKRLFGWFILIIGLAILITELFF